MKNGRPVSDVNIIDSAVLPAPELLCRDLNPSPDILSFVASSRDEISQILFGNDKRKLMVIGPCSIHDTEAGLEYADKLAELSESVKDRLLIVMRVYFEKPRTTVGWKGLIMDPDLDGSYDIPAGLTKARKFLIDVLSRGLPTATELLDPITPQYISDLICWSAIGARTTESQTHRQMASGLSMPLGFKNATSGDIVVALNAIQAASQPQTFLGISHQGLASAVTTRGNKDCHLILRGGKGMTNYDPQSVQEATELMTSKQIRPSVMIDCSHANSEKDHNRQPTVLTSAVDQAVSADSPVVGFMLESNLVEGNQPLSKDPSELKYGQSITDACIGWETTVKAIEDTYQRLKPLFV